jgi:hypothetical protein
VVRSGDCAQGTPWIRPWTRAYLAIRLGREPDAFPETDLGLIRAAQVDSPAQLLKLADRLAPVSLPMQQRTCGQ